MSQVKLGDKNIPFIYQGNELLYPNPVKDGLVLWYDFKGMKNSDVSKNVAKDLSGNGNDGTTINFAYTSDSGYNNGLKFDGIDDFIEVKSPNLLNNIKDEITISITLEFSDNTGSWRWLLSNTSDASATGGYGVAFNPSSSSTLSFRWGGQVLYSRYLPKKGDSVCLHFSGSVLQKTLNIYNNGSKIDTTTLTGTPKDTKNNLLIGKSAYNNSETLNAFIKSVKVYNRCLTDQEIQSDYKLEKERWGL
ncbi:LamG domain-containing protein [Mammaliicoccus sp. A-M2]|uniref:LamG domain-containing protein n=1 Tax=Mammaliicoccus sp. A-M2 TaxID=2898662 RepID=UPI001EFA38EA|nr:LamG domain-containing protein [Mammaliicoccus sp. A-M2]